MTILKPDVSDVNELRSQTSYELKTCYMVELRKLMQLELDSITEDKINPNLRNILETLIHQLLI